MRLKLLLLITLFAPAIVFAQDDDWDWGDFDIDFGWNHKNPYMSLSYGMSENSYFGLQGKLANTGFVEGKLGYSHTTTNFWGPGFEKEAGLFFGRYAYNLGRTANGTEIQASAWKFGLEGSSGIPWQTGDVKIIPYHSRGWQWAYITYDSLNTTSQSREILDQFNESVRFGNRFEGGLKFRVKESFEIGAGYQRSIIYPKHMFWYWAGSSLIEEIGQGLIDGFISKVSKASPGAAPIVYFILKNALSYGAYELRKDKMNWPFETAPPFFSDSYKVTLTWIF